MICVDQNGQAVEISVADQMWLDDAYFKEKQLRLGTDAPRAALALSGIHKRTGRP